MSDAVNAIQIGRRREVLGIPRKLDRKQCGERTAFTVD
jgi:hypothetical protein